MLAKALSISHAVIAAFSLVESPAAETPLPFRWVVTTVDVVHDAAFDRSGNCYVGLADGALYGSISIGETRVVASNALAKISPDGTLFWLVPLPFSQLYSAKTLVAVTSNDHVIALTRDSAVVRVSPAGVVTVLATNVFGPPGGFGFTGGEQMVIDSQDNIYIAGENGFGAHLVSLSPTGSVRWTQSHRNFPSCRFTSLWVSAPDEVVAAGWFHGIFEFLGFNLYSSGDSDGLIVKYGPAGARLSAHRYGGAERETFSALTRLDDSFFFVGQLQTIAGDSQSAIFGRADAEGVHSVQTLHNGVVNSITASPGGLLYTGETIFVVSRPHSHFDGVISARGRDGTVLWDHRIRGPYNDSVKKIAFSPRGDMVAIGKFQESASFDQMIVPAPFPGYYESHFIAKLSRFPTIGAQPQGRPIHVGEPLRLEVTAPGPDAFTYTWHRGQEEIPGQTASVLFLPSATSADAGEYWVRVRNEFDYADSQRAAITIIPDDTVEVSTVAGSGEQGFANSSNPLLAKFSAPDGGGVTRDGVIYIGDAGNHCIRYILPSGEVGTWAGTPTASGYREDLGADALFNVPLGLNVTSSGDLLIGDYFNHRVRRALGLGYRSTALLAGGGNDLGVEPLPGPTLRLNGPNDLVQAPNGEIYFTEFLNHTVRKIGLNGNVTIVAGYPGQSGFANGRGTEARFNGPAGLTLRNGDLIVTDWNNHRIRKIAPWGEVTTLAGSGSPGLQSGYGTAAQFSAPNGIVADPAGNLYITEFSNHTIRRIAPDGWVSTLAGNGTPGHADGDRETARFRSPGGISIHPDTSLIVADTGNHRIRRIVLNNTTIPINRSEGFLTVDLNPTLKIHGSIGDRYRIESTDSLSPNNWQPIESITLTQPIQTWTDPRQDPNRQRLFRAVRE